MMIKYYPDAYALVKKDEVKVCELKEMRESTIIRHGFHRLTRIFEK
jgi:hypothetical protein